MRARKAVLAVLLAVSLVGLSSTCQVAIMDGRYPTAEYRLRRRLGASPLHSLVGVAHPTRGDSPEFPITDYLGQPVEARDGVLTLRHLNHTLDRTHKVMDLFWLFPIEIESPPEYRLLLRTADGRTVSVSFPELVRDAKPAAQKSVATFPGQVEYLDRSWSRSGPPAEYEFPVSTYTVK